MSEAYGSPLLPIFAQEGAEMHRGRSCKLTGCEVYLTGKQESFCSRAHASAWWDMEHPRIRRPAPPEGERKRPDRERLFELMLDRAWRTELEMAEALGILQGTAGARRRDLCKAKYGACVFEKRQGHRPYAPKALEFKLVKP